MAKSPSIQPTRELVKIHVKFTMITPDGLRRISFDLEKDTDDDTISWKIGFQLFERDKKSDPFDDEPVVDLEVDIDAKLNAKAEAMAENGMTPSQAAFAAGPAADTAKDPAVSHEKKATTVQNTLKK